MSLRRATLLLVLVAILACAGEPSRADRIRVDLLDAASDTVLVVAHRGAAKRAPENSIPALEEAIVIGVHIVEVDVRRTKDGRLVLMHDATVDRTTTGRGRVAGMTLAEVRNLRLLDREGGSTEPHVPTLAEALRAAKDRVLVNVDKASGLLAEVYGVAEETGTLDQVLFKGGAGPAEAQADLAALPGPVLYMPVVRSGEEDDPASVRARLSAYLSRLRPRAIEVIFSRETDPLIAADLIAFLRERGCRVWVNTLWDDLCAGHTDAKALADPDANWGWVLDRGATILQTDEPAALLRYLRQRGPGR